MPARAIFPGIFSGSSATMKRRTALPDESSAVWLFQ
jgi:hypothetical protein